MANETFRGTMAPDLAEGGSYRAVIHAHFPAVRNATAARLSGSGAVPGFAPGEAAAADWSAAAERRFGAAVALRPEGRTVLAVSVEPHLLKVHSFNLAQLDRTVQHMSGRADAASAIQHIPSWMPCCATTKTSSCCYFRPRVGATYWYVLVG